MSEYQYYEFLALDRPLSEQQMQEVRRYSTRARITATRFVNEYHWGDFKGDIDRLMAKYYDAFVYFANWGTRNLRFRLPTRDFDVCLAKRYCAPYIARFRKAGRHVILSLSSEDESGGDWESDGGWMPALAPLRADLLAGDYRCLYLGWLNGVCCREVDENQAEPPVPPGLGEWTAPLKALADFLRIDESLIEAAAEASPPLANQQESAEQLRSRVESLPSRQKDELLVRLIQEPPVVVQRELSRRLRQNKEPQQGGGVPGRTAGKLLAMAKKLDQEKRRLLAERHAREQVRREREAAAARQKRLDALAKQESQAWSKVDALIATRQPKGYDQAVELLRDLKDLAQRQGQLAEAKSRLRSLRQRNGRKPALMRRLDSARLID